MLKILSAPQFDDSELTRKAGVFYNVIIGGTIIISILEIFEWIVNPNNSLRWILIIVTFNIINLGLLFLNRKRKTILASYIFSVFILCLIFVLAWTAGGIRASAVQEIPIIVVCVGLMLGWRNGIFFSVLTILLSLFLVVADYLHFLPQSNVVTYPIGLWVNVSIRLIILAFLQYLFNANTNKALKEAKNELLLREKTENELRESEARYRFISENTADVLWTYRFSENRFTYVSESVTKLRGFTPDEVTKQSFDDVLTPESQKIVSDTIQKLLEERKPNDTSIYKSVNELYQKCKDGSIIPTEVSTSLIFDKFGRPDTVIGISRDITERKISEQRIKESEQLFKNIIFYAPFPIVLAEFDTTYVVVNKCFCDINGLTEEETIGKTAYELGFVVSDDDIAKIENELKTKGDVNGLEITVTDRRGQVFEFLFSSSIIQFRNKSMFLNITIDITEKKKVERELEQYRNQLELLVKEKTEELGSTIEELHSANEDLSSQKEELESAINNLQVAQNKLIQSEKMVSLGLLSAGIAHEINNPLNFIHGGILGINDYLNDNLKEHKAKLDPLIDAINIGVKRASEIVSSLSHYSRKDELPFTKCDINTIIDNCLIILQSKLKNKIEIIKHYASNNIYIIGNEGKLHQVFLNIISNAEQAIDKKGIIEIVSEMNNSSIKISISDNGHGISSDNIQKIFDPFFTTKEPGKGTGLGLSITYNIIQEHNGTIEIQSELNKGTTLIITFPIV